MSGHGSARCFSCVFRRQCGLSAVTVGAEVKNKAGEEWRG